MYKNVGVQICSIDKENCTNSISSPITTFYPVQPYSCCYFEFMKVLKIAAHITYITKHTTYTLDCRCLELV